MELLAPRLSLGDDSAVKSFVTSKGVATFGINFMQFNISHLEAAEFLRCFALVAKFSFATERRMNISCKTRMGNRCAWLGMQLVRFRVRRRGFHQ